MKTQYLYIFTALKKSDSTSRFRIVFDPHALNYLFVSSVQNCGMRQMWLSSVSQEELHILAWWVGQVFQTKRDQPLLLLIVSDLFCCRFLNPINK